MAKMYPADLENYVYTGSEKYMYEQLQAQLSDKYHVFYSIRWFGTDENNKRVDSECDFLVFDPSFGFLTIEVKGGVGMHVEKNARGEDRWVLDEERDNRGNITHWRELKCSPYEQADKSKQHFYDYFKDEFRQYFNGAYGSAVAIPFYACASIQGFDAPPEITIDIGDMKNLAKRINQIFHYWKEKTNSTVPFTKEQSQKFISVINKQVSLSAAAGALIELKEKEFSKIDFVQDGILDALYHYPQVRILGGAGTGKTFIAMKKAGRDIAAHKKVLFLCCSKALTRFVERRLGAKEGMDILTYEELMRKSLGDDYDRAEINENGNRNCFDLVADAGHDLYDSIIVDEGQDFDADMGLTVRLFLRDESQSNLYVFYDVNQNVFEHKFDNAFAIDRPPFILRYNIRNTGRIYDHAVQATGLGEDTIANSLLGVEPDILDYRNERQGFAGLDKIVSTLTRREYVQTKSIVILSDDPYAQSILAGQTSVGGLKLFFGELSDVKDTEICFKTAEEFKGLEADVVIYLKNVHPSVGNADSTPGIEEIKRRKEYVSLTRARYYLYVLHVKRNV